MKIATISTIITPPVGTLLAGYGSKDVSESIHDDLMARGLCFDDGERKALLLSFDLIGLEMSVVSELRRRCAELIGGEVADAADGKTLTNSEILALNRCKIGNKVVTYSGFIII